jgi:hypothetical protein
MKKGVVIARPREAMTHHAIVNSKALKLVHNGGDELQDQMIGFLMTQFPLSRKGIASLSRNLPRLWVPDV